MDEKKIKTFAALFEELNGVPFSFDETSLEANHFLTDEMDHTILMHRDAHFGGDFQVMLNYYNNPDHIGIDPDLDIDRIHYLSDVERALGRDLAPLMLTAAEAELVGQCKNAYIKFKELYEQEGPDFESAKLLADLILSEEEEPFHEIDAIVEKKDLILPYLLELIRSDEAYSTLFPGYGYAPYLAAICLGKMQHVEALIPLFSMFHRETIFGEEALLDAFATIGEPAKEFLLSRLKGRPLTIDNTHAAFALTAFSADLEVAKIALEQLKDREIQRNSLLCTYLLCLVDPLQHQPQKQELIALGDMLNIPKELHLQIKNLVRDWH